MQGWGALMSEVEVKISSERIDDIPLIVEWLKRIEIAKYNTKSNNVCDTSIYSRAHGVPTCVNLM
ncbi:hypothetical protein FDUTEX481_05618 [Tolypothrix sp. PCC 7601]|nr:hypothetical protein FDUTEX481_05618 [Tolypothrix sp. PCC 7601]